MRPSSLLQGLRLPPYTPVLDLETPKRRGSRSSLRPGGTAFDIMLPAYTGESHSVGLED
jgi:hypothetical protein